MTNLCSQMMAASVSGPLTRLAVASVVETIYALSASRVLLADVSEPGQLSPITTVPGECKKVK